MITGCLADAVALGGVKMSKRMVRVDNKVSEPFVLSEVYWRIESFGRVEYAIFRTTVMSDALYCGETYLPVSGAVCVFVVVVTFELFLQDTLITQRNKIDKIDFILFTVLFILYEERQFPLAAINPQ